MKRLFKRTLVCLIAVMMVVSSLPMTALARGGYNWFDVTQGVTMTGSSAGKYGVLFKPHNNNSDFDIYGYVLATFQPKDSSGSDITVSSDGTFNVQRGTNFSMYMDFGKYLYDSKCGGATDVSTFISNMDKSSPSWHYGDSSNSTRNFSTYVEKNYSDNYWQAYLGTSNAKGNSITAVQSGVDGTFANNKTSQNYASTTNLYATMSFSTSSFSGLNTCGEYTLRIRPNFSFRNNSDIQVSTETSASSDIFTEVVFKVRVVDTYTFKDYKGSTVKTVQATSASEAYNSRPTNSTQNITANNNGTHTVTTYSWPTSPSNYVFTETGSSSTVNCSGGTATCTAKAKCSVCGAEYGSVLGHSYTYTSVDKTYHKKACTRGDDETTEEHTLGTDGKCTLCNEQLLDFTAYDAAYEEAGNIIATQETGNVIYTTDSYNEYKATVKSANDSKANATTQAEVNNLTAIIIAAKSVLRKNTCTVKLYVYSNDSTSAEPTTKDVAYGDLYEQNLEEFDNTVKAIIVKTDNGATQTKLNIQNKLSLYVTKDVEIEVYLASTPSDTKEYSKVIFLGKSGNIVNIQYVEKDVELATGTVTVPAIPFYTSNGWDKDSVTGTGNDIYVRAKYTADSAASCNVHFVDKWNKEYSYDSYVYLNGADKSKMYALASDENGNNILTYLDGIEFYAPKTADIYVVEVQSKEAKIAITGNFKEELTENEVEKVAASFNCKFYLPEDCTAIEWGAEISSGGITKKVKAESISGGNEYTIRMKVKKTLVTGGSVTSFTGKAYLIYKDANGTTQTIYSDEVTQELK